MTTRALPPEALCRHCDPDQFNFDTTDELEDLEGFIGQERATESLHFGLGVEHKGYNLYALGPAGAGKSAMVRKFLKALAAERPIPSDWFYVNNFSDARKPHAVALPAGQGVMFKEDMEQLVIDLQEAIPLVFESDEYHTRRQAKEDRLEERQENAMAAMQKKAEEKHIALINTPTGFTLGPKQNDKILGPEQFHKLPEKEQEVIEQDVKALQEELRRTLHAIPQWQKEAREEISKLNREMTASAVHHLIDAVREKYRDNEAVIAFLDRVEDDVINNYQQFLPHDERKPTLFGLPLSQQEEGPPWHYRYRVNLLLAHEANGGAPIVYEDLPGYNNLVGRIEHRAHLGALETDFTMIRPGALHRANGGYLILDALKLLFQPFAWETLKRVLQSGEIRIESLAQITSLISTQSLEPEPIPLHVKVVLLGERHIYYLLQALDPEFDELFKVAVDFDDDLVRDSHNEHHYGQLVATLARQHKLRPLDRYAVARVIDRSMRLADDNERLSSHMRSLTDLIQQADFWAGEQGHKLISRDDVQQAIEAQIHRADRVQQRLQDEVVRGTLMIATDGEVVGQINGLSVVLLGDQRFGHPNRITARARLGKGQVVDIEREVELGGPIHSKGVYILSGFIAGRYVPDYPLSLSASLVFEQSYGGVEGDSASSAELYALLSALSGLPIKQQFAVTGSVNQMGEVQAIGGVNEKIEGFFDICRTRGLSGHQGVLIPSANTKHLILREDVVQAVKAGEFAVYPIENIDQGIALLTGTPAGTRDENGEFPEDSVNGRVEASLIRFSERMQSTDEMAVMVTGEDQ
ncbi:MAG: AAA family ATPase [Candidatus Thiodiazotropha sp. (ex Lucina aurantia)]|nr:AAA family ATPase [Candidatus Thiodiazotropha sp. (ex Lucina pensylvanica)]MBT3023002.1 AAA family ATPase [Candidatus Thiodiazotropha taylori]MBV2100011.1 AAA family ATPase [Candidatus Thiodiazotropha sp. (ex Codakia orbicularis)]MBV2102668.1 AAA family ATPase [Candidatus Thiodiazotropha sp. (ex Lucina aurantia)]MBV2117239.1 AAA family ATPase [Candidatus Thiodiazotropha sp. (ex Lucina aurantia)]